MDRRCLVNNKLDEKERIKFSELVKVIRNIYEEESIKQRLEEVVTDKDLKEVFDSLKKRSRMYSNG
jgi:hypothetical protein